MEISFHGKRALVTGAGKGIGRALTLKLAECGAEVVAVSRTQSDLESLKKESPKIQTLCLDISNWELTNNALKNVGSIDLLVNNAGVLDIIEYGKYTEQDYDNCLALSLSRKHRNSGYISLMIAEDMKKRGKGGAIVNVSSVLGYTVSPSYGVYCASKGAVDQLTRSMAVEFGPYNIRVNSVNPTVVRTRMAEMEGLLDKGNEIAQDLIKRTPLKRFADPEDIVNPILFLLSDKAAMITGITLPVDGGITVSFN
ncbi:unnamed protein product [Larinioides sclopetarius]|uniref:L-xylulose reductase n=1 Tax=Larinioides sclopetarius TaxID=280406 RepID=A0AAV2A5T2_9ARAC